jgi:hypothetical protein
MEGICLNEVCMSFYMLSFLILIELLFYSAVGLGAYKLYYKAKSKLYYKDDPNKKSEKSKN